MSTIANLAQKVYEQCPDIRGPILENADVITISLGTQVAAQQFYAVLGRLIGNGAARAIRVTFFYASPKTAKLAEQIFKGEYWTLVEGFQSAQANLWHSIVVHLNHSPKELIAMHAASFCKREFVGTVCQVLGSLSDASVGEMVYIAVAPVVAPAVSPAVKMSLLTGAKLALGYFYREAPKLAQDEKESIELTNFKEEEEWEVLERSETT